MATQLKATARLKEMAAGSTINVQVFFPIGLLKPMFKGQNKEMVAKILKDKDFLKNLSNDLVHTWKAHNEAQNVEPEDMLAGLVPPKFTLK